MCLAIPGKIISITAQLDETFRMGKVSFGGIMKDPWGNQKAIITVNGKINRKDWNLVWNVALEAGGVLVSDEVGISCEVQLFKAQ